MGQLQQAKARIQPPVEEVQPEEAAVPEETVEEEMPEEQENPEDVEAEESAAEDSEAATPEEQQEYDKAMDALYMVLYQNEKTSQAVEDQLNAEDKVGSVVRAGLLVIKALDQKIQMDEAVIPQMTREVADSLVEMAEAKGIPPFTDGEAKAVLGAMWEGVMQVFGFDEEQAKELTEGMSPEELQQSEDQYQQFLSEAGGADPAAAQPPVEGAAPEEAV